MVSVQVLDTKTWRVRVFQSMSDAARHHRLDVRTLLNRIYRHGVVAHGRYIFREEETDGAPWPSLKSVAVYKISPVRKNNRWRWWFVSLTEYNNVDKIGVVFNAPTLAELAKPVANLALLVKTGQGQEITIQGITHGRLSVACSRSDGAGNNWMVFKTDKTVTELTEEHLATPRRKYLANKLQASRKITRGGKTIYAGKDAMVLSRWSGYNYQVLAKLLREHNNVVTEAQVREACYAVSFKL